MSVVVKGLIDSKYAANAITTQYTADLNSKMRTTIDKFTGVNITGGALTLSVYLVPYGGTADNSNLRITKSLAAGESYGFPEVAGHTLNPGGFIATNASAANSINIQSSGRENTP